jgi:plasmid stabilization system protein ParE
MNYGFHPEAEAELNSAIEYYEQREPGLGFDFSLEVYSSLQGILSFPQSWPVLDGEVRRCLIHRFPYGILYSVEADSIFVLAIMHLRREPGYWKDRLK